MHPALTYAPALPAEPQNKKAEVLDVAHDRETRSTERTLQGVEAQREYLADGGSPAAQSGNCQERGAGHRQTPEGKPEGTEKNGPKARKASRDEPVRAQGREPNGGRQHRDSVGGDCEPTGCVPREDKQPGAKERR